MQKLCCGNRRGGTGKAVVLVENEGAFQESANKYRNPELMRLTSLALFPYRQTENLPQGVIMFGRGRHSINSYQALLLSKEEIMCDSCNTK
ncbi:hypothetical protein XENTR_v10010892 [Xenopus tropicalis]|nr:hypothetical protein XENTR_v10010892 [Xenopus tropicalis]